MKYINMAKPRSKRPRFLLGEKEKKKKKLVTATAVARRGEQGRQGTVFVEAEEECDNDWQATTVKDTRTEAAVFRAENKQSDKNPKGYVSLGATIHKNLLCLPQDVCIFW